MPDLTEAQTAVLAPALSRDDRCVFPIVAPLKGGAVGNIARSLLRRGLIEEVVASDTAVVWRCSEDGQPLTLRLSDAGASALTGSPGVGVSQCHEALVEPALVPVDIGSRPHGSRQQALLALLSRPEGATVAEMQLATGWQAHSVRGALSGVVAKKLGHKVASTKEERGRVYRIQP
jgi:hypothetical protein